MTRSSLALLLLFAGLTAGCQQSSAVSNTPEASLPAQAVPRFTARKIVGETEVTAPAIPPVSLSGQHSKWCVSKVGDPFPATELPRLGGQRTKLSTLYGKQATLVIFWQNDRWMSRWALEDIAREIAAKYDPQAVGVVGIIVGPSASFAQKVLSGAKADFPQLYDSKGTALAEVGSVALPRLYVLDPTGKIVWFDIEYSESTRRELAQTVGVLRGADER